MGEGQEIVGNYWNSWKFKKYRQWGIQDIGTVVEYSGNSWDFKKLRGIQEIVVNKLNSGKQNRWKFHKQQDIPEGEANQVGGGGGIGWGIKRLGGGKFGTRLVGWKGLWGGGNFIIKLVGELLSGGGLLMFQTGFTHKKGRMLYWSAPLFGGTHTFYKILLNSMTKET